MNDVSLADGVHGAAALVPRLECDTCVGVDTAEPKLSPGRSRDKKRPMPFEIERKFLVASESWRADVTRSIQIHDGLLATGPDSKVRIRINGSGTLSVLDDSPWTG